MDAMSPNDPAAFVAAALASKPDLIVHEADRPETVRAVLKVLVQGGNLFDRGGVLVRLVRSPGGGPPTARQLTYNNVIVETHQHCQPVKFTADGNRVAITLPDAVARMLLDLGEWGLPPLAGVTTAPLLAADGSILVRAGYDRAHAMWCEPVPDLTVPIQPTRVEAEAALLLLRTAFRTFPFAGSPMVTRGENMVVDVSKPPSSAESAFLAALQTACCRASLWLAPGVLIVAPEVSGAGSGKGLLVRAICMIGFGCPPSAFTPGHDRQELDKRLVATLIEARPAVFLDNLNSTALRSNTLASLLTERPAHVRVMGRSEMVPLNCAAFESRPPLLFARADSSLYTSLATLPQRAGVPASMLPWLVVKEFSDNALDAADAAAHPGAVEIDIDHHGNLTIADEGAGIPAATPEQIAHLFSVARPMLSSKLLRRPTRGAVGNGLRVCLGYLTATRGRLAIETGSLRVELAPEIDGTSRIVSSSAVPPQQGLRLIAIAGDAPFVEEHLAWAQDAIELARQSGQPAFTGRPSPHWLDLDHFRALLRAAVGNISVRQFLGELDGCTGSRAQTRIAIRFLRRAAAELDAAEAAILLNAAQAATKSPKPRALRPLGRAAVVAAGYAIAEGTFTEGAHAPHAKIPFLVECWADGFSPEEQPDRLIITLHMNRTRAIAPCTGNAWHGQLELSISGTGLRVPVPAGPHYSVVVNITSPMFRLTSDGKQPDCRPFRDTLIEAIGKAAKQAGRDIAEEMSAEQKRADAQGQQQRREETQVQRLADREVRRQRLERIKAQKAERKALPTIRETVLELLPRAVAVEASSGFMFNTRRLVYRIRDDVMRRTGRELTQNYFDDLLTQIEAEQGDLHPLLIREARGNYSIPHFPDDAIPLGTQSVRAFRRPPWAFNKIVAIEKEDLRLMLRQARWDELHDAFLTSAKGFTTRAARDLIDKIADTTEPVKVFSVHDGDWAGTLIQHTLQNATLARAARKIEIIDLGLQPWEGVILGLSVERVPTNYNKNGELRRYPVGEYVRARTDQAPAGETWEGWLQHSRVELNAFTSAQLIEWLDRNMAEHNVGKLIPPDDILKDQFSERVRGRAEGAVQTAISDRLDNLIAAISAEQAEATKEIRAEIDRITADLRAQEARLAEPFHQRIDAARLEALAIDREAVVHQVIRQMSPDADHLRAEISTTFSNKPRLHWSTVVDQIADGTEVGDVDAGGPS